MFSKQEFLEYFDQVRALEITAEEVYGDLLKTVTDPFLRKIFESIYRDEVRHNKLIKEISEIIQLKS